MSDQLHCRFPIARDSFRGYYYPYGNTPPEDLLEHVRSCEEPSILLLGCGDIRSCLYTLWKHFDPLYCNDLCTQIQFTLNDQCAAVLARNVLFLYLLLEKAEAKEKEWIPSIWAIWYCHELLPHHLEVLKSALTDLLSLSASQETWTTSNHPTCSMCCFSGETLQQVREVWNVWHYKPFGTPESVKTVRQKMQASCGFSAGVSSHYVSVFLGEMRQGKEETTFDAMVRDYEYYFKEGTAYAEVVCGQPDMCSDQHVVNPTFFERYLKTNTDSNQYTAYCTLVPYRCFCHSIQFTSEKISQCGLHEGKVKQLVAKSAFKKHPLLANSVQQFSLWLSSAAKVLKNKKPCVTFSFHCLDAIEHCQIMLKDKIKFDVIYTSNLLDYLSPILLVLPSVDLLKENCVMITTSLKSSVKIEEFIEQSFGFNSELLPVVFGIRCIGHDGQYTDHYSIEPIPYLPSSTSYFREFRENGSVAAGIAYCCALQMIWEKVQLEPLRVMSLSEVPAISNALHSLAKKAITSFFLDNRAPVPITSTETAKQVMTNFLQNRIKRVPTTTETAIIAFLAFISQLYSTVPYDSHYFWKHLCDLLKADSTMKPFLHQIQTHALLHGLHLHLTLNEMNCPVCNKLLVSDFICQLAVEFPVPIPAETFVRPAFTVFCHSKDNFNCPLTSTPWEMGATVIDSIACKREGLKIEINFFTSLKDMVITVVGQDVCVGPQQKVICSSLPVSCSRKIEPFVFSFVQPKSQPISSPSSFGTLVRHAGDSHEFVSKIELCDEVSSVLKAEDPKKILKTEHSFPCILKISVNKHHFQLIYPYDIVYTKVRMILAKDKATVDLKITRDCRKWSHEKPLFITCPSNKFCFPDLMIANDQLFQYDDRQYTRDERTVLKFNDSLGMIGVKKILSSLLHSDCQYIALLDGPDPLLVQGLVVIHRKMFDIEKYSPAIHISFLMETIPVDRINSSDPLWNFWQSVISLHYQITKDEAACLKELLMHFAARTRLRKENGPIISKRHRLEHLFTQAVVYPLYLDKDKYYADRACTVPSPDIKATEDNNSNTSKTL